MPKYLDYFETAAEANDGEWLIDGRWTYADTSLFQLWEGLSYMFPRRMRTLAPRYPGLKRVRDLVAELPGIRAYVAGEEANSVYSIDVAKQSVLRTIKAERTGLPVMLVTNYSEYQQAAIAAGGPRGSGLAQLARGVVGRI